MSHCHQSCCCHTQSGCHSSHQMKGGCGCSSCSCQGSQGSCGCGCQSGKTKDQSCQYASKLLDLANQAWLDLLKEKIKEHMQANAQCIDELAQLIAQANHDHWKAKMANQNCYGNFEQKLKEFLSCGSSCHTQSQPSDKEGNK